MKQLRSYKRIALAATALAALLVAFGVFVGRTGNGNPPQPASSSPVEVMRDTPEMNVTEEHEQIQKVGQGVLETLQAEGEVNVVIALTEPPSMNASPFDLPTVKREIADLQDEVLSSLTPSDYCEKLRYQAVPALAGKILSEAGLAKLVANPKVVRIDLDVGGSGNQ